MKNKEEELKEEIEKEMNAKTYSVADHNGKLKYHQRNYKRIYELKAELKGIKEGKLASIQDEIKFLERISSLKNDFLLTYVISLIKERIDKLQEIS